MFSTNICSLFLFASWYVDCSGSWQFVFGSGFDRSTRRQIDWTLVDRNWTSRLRHKRRYLPNWSAPSVFSCALAFIGYQDKTQQMRIDPWIAVEAHSSTSSRKSTSNDFNSFPDRESPLFPVRSIPANLCSSIPVWSVYLTWKLLLLSYYKVITVCALKAAYLDLRDLGWSMLFKPSCSKC